MRKAFLCHSSADEEYVRIVAHRLGRENVVYDDMAFAPGQDFRDAIAKGMDEAGLFVFFASKASLDSVWCRHEIDEASYRAVTRQLEKQLTLIVDRSVSYDDLPRWLSRTKAQIQTRPTQAVRDIQHSLLSILPPQYKRPFVGRQWLMEQFAKQLATCGNDSRRIFVVTGLEGVGRRSYLDRVVADNLALHLGPFLRVDESQDLADIYFWALDETAELCTRAQMADEIATFSRLAPEEQVRRDRASPAPALRQPLRPMHNRRRRSS